MKNDDGKIVLRTTGISKTGLIQRIGKINISDLIHVEFKESLHGVDVEFSLQYVSDSGRREFFKSFIPQMKDELAPFFYTDDMNTNLEKVVGILLSSRKKTVALAESCTGGLISSRLTDVPGSSSYFLMGLVVYSNAAKEKLLKVPADTIEKYGAVSKETAEQMSLGILELSGADVALGVTGLAGPGGGTKSKPVGTVWFSYRTVMETITKGEKFKGNRREIKFRASQFGLDMIRRHLTESGAL